MASALPRSYLVCLFLVLWLFPAHHPSAREIGTADKLSVSIGTQTLGKEPLTLDERIWAMQFTADGKALLTVTDKIDRIEWPSKKRQTLWQPVGGETMVRATFSPDGTLFANSENGDKVHVHETATGKLLYTFQGRSPRFTATAWSSDGGRLAIGAGKEVVIYEMKTGTAVQKVALGNSGINALAWSPDDKWIVAETEKVGDSDRSVVLRSLHEDSAPILLPGNRETRFSFSPDSKTLVVATEKTTATGATGILYIWDLVAGKEIHSEPRHSYNSMVHSPDGRLLVGCGLNSLEILDAQTGREVARQDSDWINNHIWSAGFSPDGKILATGNGDRVCFRDTTTWNEIDPDDVLRAPVSALAFSGDGRRLVTGGLNGDLVLWDWEKKAPIWKCFSPGKAWNIRALSIDPASQWIGVVQHPFQTKSPSIRLVDFATGKTARWVDVPKLTDAAPLFHPSRRTAYVATHDHELVEWDCESGETLNKLPIPFLRTTEAGRFGAISTLDFDPATPEVIRWTAETQASGRIDVRNGLESCLLEARIGRPNSDPIPPRGHDFTAIGSRVWNLPTFHEITPGESDGHRPSVRHPSGLLQFTASGQRVRVFDILSQSFIHAFEFGSGEINAIALSPDGRTLIAASTGGIRYLSLEGPPVAPGTSPEVLWELMGGENSWEAYQAAWALARQPDYVQFLESHLTPAREPGADELAHLKTLLVDSNHQVRQSAARQWLDLGLEIDRKTLETLRQGGLSEKWPGVAAVNPVAFSGIDPRGPIPLLTPLSPHCRAMRAVMLLKADRSEGSRKLLERLAHGYAGAPLTQAAAKALSSQR